MILRIVLIPGLALALAGCGGADGTAADGRTSVVAAFYPLAFAAEQIGGETVDVTNLTPPGAEPHDVELSARDVEHDRDRRTSSSTWAAASSPALDDRDRGSVSARSSTSARIPTAERSARLARPRPVRRDRRERIGEELGREPQAQRPRVTAPPARPRVRARPRATASVARSSPATPRSATSPTATASSRSRSPGSSPEAEPTPRELEHVVDQVRRAGATTVFFETLVSPRARRDRRARGRRDDRGARTRSRA